MFVWDTIEGMQLLEPTVMTGVLRSLPKLVPMSTAEVHTASAPRCKMPRPSIRTECSADRRAGGRRDGGQRGPIVGDEPRVARLAHGDVEVHGSIASGARREQARDIRVVQRSVVGDGARRVADEDCGVRKEAASLWRARLVSELPSS